MVVLLQYKILKRNIVTYIFLSLFSSLFLFFLLQVLKFFPELLFSQYKLEKKALWESKSDNSNITEVNSPNFSSFPSFSWFTSLSSSFSSSPPRCQISLISSGSLGAAFRLTDRWDEIRWHLNGMFVQRWRPIFLDAEEEEEEEEISSSLGPMRRDEGARGEGLTSSWAQRWRHYSRQHSNLAWMLSLLRYYTAC